MYDKALLESYPNIEWEKIKEMRDIITHHYFDLNAEAIFDVCQNHVEKLGQTIEKMIVDLNRDSNG